MVLVSCRLSAGLLQALVVLAFASAAFLAASSASIRAVSYSYHPTGGGAPKSGSSSLLAAVHEPRTGGYSQLMA